jgi:hypothetical protein
MINLIIAPFLMAFFANADMSMNMAEAKMAAQVMVSSTATVGYYDKLQKQRKLTAEETEIFSLAQVAQQVFAVKDFTTYGGGQSDDDKIKNVNLSTVAQSIQAAIELRDWNQALSNPDLEKAKKQRDVIKKALGENSLALAWLTYQAGDKAEAKNILNRGFTKSYEETMKLQHVYGHGSGPMYSGESYSKALTPLSTEQENKSRAEKLQKMRTHLSNLPDMQIMT